MKVGFWCIGKTDDPYIKEGFDIYQKRLGNYLNFEYREIIPSKNKKSNVSKNIEAERDEILKLLKQNDVLILLDETGKEFNSVGFSVFLQKKFNETNGSLIFLSGGAYGFHEDIYKRSTDSVSLSKMTFTHQMVRLIFIEQLYRAVTILKGEKYHH